MTDSIEKVNTDFILITMLCKMMQMYILEDMELNRFGQNINYL